ncbi:MAG: glycerol-3-phosphate dehydrogenase [Oscillospiraceae bacterium]|nr:glycerol-3-phosphate dehydrogenase [Oscillospiraceae bacterium]
MKTITIIGAGMMGSALAFPARENGNEVRIVGTPLDRDIIEHCRRTNRHPKFQKEFPAGITYYHTEELEAAICGVDFIICGVSSFGVDWFRDEILPRLNDHVPVISVTKGLMDLEDGSLITYPDIWQQKLDELGKQIPLNAIGGPCTSYELVAHDQTQVTYCGKDMQVLRMIKAAMETDYYHISLSSDVVGVESAVALKNGYALGVALTIGLNQQEFGLDSELHFNSQAAIFGQSLREMSKLLKLQGAEDLDNLVVGIGDLYVTVYGGRTRLIGILLGRGLDIDAAKAELQGITLESLVVAERVAKAIRIKAARGLADLKEFPLMMHIDEIITQHKAVEIPWETFTYEA